jgi:hypothetical protein
VQSIARQGIAKFAENFQMKKISGSGRCVLPAPEIFHVCGKTTIR